MFISNDEARIRAWIELQQEISEGIIQLTLGDVKQLMKIIDEERNKNQKLLQQERNLSDAYVRLRLLIPGALNTHTAPTPEEIWKLTEDCLKKLLPQESFDAQGNKMFTCRKGICTLTPKCKYDCWEWTLDF